MTPDFPGRRFARAEHPRLDIICAHDAPTELLTGLMEGSLEATLEVWADGQPTGEIIPFSGTFVLPVYPEGWPGGWP